jgi:hypothetical protein
VRNVALGLFLDLSVALEFPSLFCDAHHIAGASGLLGHHCRLQEGHMQGLYAATNRAAALLNSVSFDAVQLFSLLGVTVSIAMSLHVNAETLTWALAHIE